MNKIIAIIFSLFITAPVLAAEPIKIGDISSYTAGPSYQTPYKKGWQMALDEINNSGGVLGQPLAFVSRDDMGKPEEALRIADDLTSHEKVSLLTSSGFANVELALSSFAKKNKILYIAACYNSDHFIWDQRHAYAFRIGGPPPYVFNAMLAERAAQQKKVRWANVGPNYEWGHANWDAFKEGMKHFQPDAQFVTEQWPKVNNINAGEVVQVLLRENPDAIYTSLFGSDLAQFIREGNKRHLFDHRLVVSLSAGMIQMQDLMKTEMPQGWLVLAYPFSEIDTPEMKKFVATYQARYNEQPDFPSVYGYVWVYFLKDLILSTGSADADAMRQKLPDFKFQSIIGPLTIRALDHQSTMGAWIGTTAIVHNAPTVVDWKYISPEHYFPTDAYINNLRKNSER